ncbi:MAG: transferrin-binding protein-like solute binding protein [Geminicoccaceae bacterium]|nr:transferrin-binding protein-like solute binding protein [Geminicoccaceae bacterium]
MSRLPFLGFSALALVLSLAACTGGGSDGPIGAGQGGDGAGTTGGGTTGGNGGAGSTSGGATTGGTTTGGTTGGSATSGGTTSSGATTTGGTTGGSASEPLVRGDSPLARAIRTGDDVLLEAYKSDAGKKMKLAVAADGTFTLTRGDEPFAFATDAPAVAADRGLRTYAAGGVPLMRLTLSDIGGGALDYSLYGAWALAVNGADLADIGTVYGGLKTMAMPLSGKATYTGAAMAVEYDAATRHVLNDLAGSLNASADFAKGTVGAQMALAKADGTAWGKLNFSTVTITGNGFAGGITSTNGHLTGRVNGKFFGPAADEMAGDFGLAGGPSGWATSEVRGAFGAKR